MFVFDDLLKLDDKAIRSLLKEVENNQWAIALKGASDEIRQKIFGNLSQRAAETLKEEMEFLGPVRLTDVEGVQQQRGREAVVFGCDHEQAIAVGNRMRKPVGPFGNAAVGFEVAVVEGQRKLTEIELVREQPRIARLLRGVSGQGEIQ
jgi:hypothetical protein